MLPNYIKHISNIYHPRKMRYADGHIDGSANIPHTQNSGSIEWCLCVCPSTVTSFLYVFVCVGACHHVCMCWNFRFQHVSRTELAFTGGGFCSQHVCPLRIEARAKELPADTSTPVVVYCAKGAFQPDEHVLFPWL